VFNSTLVTYWPVIFFTFTALIHIAFSVAVYADAKQQTQYKPTGSVFVRPFTWSIAVLFGGVLIAGLYWIIHHSSLKQQ